MRSPHARFTIRWLMVLTIAVAGVLGMYAPEFRSIDKSRGILLFSLALTASFGVCFTPVWVTLLSFRRRTRRGESLRKSHYTLLFAGYFIGLILVLLSMIPLGYFVLNHSVFL
jgi:hypothetical protein